MTFDFIDINAKVAIAFSLTLIAGLLTYIAFKDPIEKGVPAKLQKHTKFM